VLLRLHVPIDYGAFHYFASVRVILSFERHYLCNNYTLFMTFGITVNTFVHMCEINVPWQICDEYSVLA
jgi:hypothetical protein